jgi:NCS1 family nucleobase:cation symporter-1
MTQMGATDWSTISEGKWWSDAIEFVQKQNVLDGNDPVNLGFWKIVVFAWLCNGAMHFGMADLSIFRFAKSPNAGWAPSIGMFLGHYMAWICAALLLAAQIKLSQDHTANPGALAWGALGWTGILCVVIAGWTTANPTIYRAGLAFQGVFPKSSRTVMTLIAGAVATVAGVFPKLSAQLLDFVGAYGTVLGPMGAVIFVDYWLIKKIGLQDEYAEKAGQKINVAVLVSWLLPVAVGLYLILWQGLFAVYAVIPCWIACGLIYLVLSKFTQDATKDGIAEST